MTPSSTKLSVPPGGSTKNSFEVINAGDTSYNISVSAAPYQVEGINYDPLFTQQPGTTNASKWVRFTSTTTQSLLAHKLTNINYVVTIPHGTAPGGYYAVLFAETTPTTNSHGVVSRNRVGNILYITVQGQVKTGGTLQSVATPYITRASSLPLAMLVGNTGGVHFVTVTNVTVKSVFGKDVFRASLQRYVLPQTVRKISATWGSMPPLGLYHIERSATIAGVYRQLPSQWLVVVHPWVVVVAGVVVLIVISRTVFKRKALRRLKS
jgi:hypothetical protein